MCRLTFQELQSILPLLPFLESSPWWRRKSQSSKSTVARPGRIWRFKTCRPGCAWCWRTCSRSWSCGHVVFPAAFWCWAPLTWTRGKTKNRKAEISTKSGFFFSWNYFGPRASSCRSKTSVRVFFFSMFISSRCSLAYKARCLVDLVWVQRCHFRWSASFLVKAGTKFILIGPIWISRAFLPFALPSSKSTFSQPF